MNWDKKAEDYAVETGLSRESVLVAARWQRDQLRTNEAIEIMAIATYEGETEQPWNTASKGIQDDCRMWARRSIDALLGGSDNE